MQSQVMYARESKSRALEASRITTAYADTRMEVGISLAWISLPDFPEPERDMILSGQQLIRLTKVAHFIPVKNHLYKCEVGQDIYDQDRMSAWSSEDHRIRQRNTVYLKVLESVAPHFGYQARFQYSLSSADRWIDRESQSDSAGHVESMCTRLWIQQG